MTHPFFIAQTKSRAMVQLGASRVHEVALAVAGKHWVRTNLDKEVVTVRIRLPWWSWMFLGVWHVHLWWKLRKYAIRRLKKLRLDLALKVRIR